MIDARRAELVERRAHARGLVLAGGDDHVGAGDLQRVGGGARRGARDDDGERDLGAPRRPARVQRQARRRSRRRRGAAGGGRPRCGRSAAGRRPARCRCRRRPRRTRRASGARVVAALLAGDPLRVAGLAWRPCRRGVIADLKSTHGRPGAGVLAERLVEQARASRRARRRRRRSRRPRRAGCRGRGPEAFSVGSSEATTTRAMPASRIASVHGGCWPWWQQGSSDTYSVAPRRSASPAGARSR